MSDQSTLDSLGLSDELDMIWTRTHEAIARKGYTIKRPPGGAAARLGQGIYGDVFYAEHIQDKTPVAIKVFKDDDPDKIASFKREAETLRAPDFPRQFAITAYDVWHEPNAQPFIVMEFILGQPIHEYCEKQSLDRARRIELIEQTLRGLQELHHRNIQHRDISVANILIDDQGRVRYLDFGLAGEIVRATRHTTIDARGNRAYSPAEVVKGDKKADEKDDIFACAMLAVHVLTGDAPPENTTHSGDSKHMARCKRQLSERGIARKLASIVLRGLRKPEDRYAQADAMADALFDYRVRRPQRIRTFWIAMAMMFVVACVGILGWWRYDQLQQEAAFRDYAVLKEQTKDLPYADHEAVAGRLEQAEQLRSEWNKQLDAGQRDEAMATLVREMTVLQEAVDIGRGLGRCLPRLEALGIPLNETPWNDHSPVIAKRCAELAQHYQDVTAILREGRIDDAWQALDALQVTLAQLIRDNAEAGTAAATRSQYNNLVGSVSERLQVDEEFAALGKLAELAEKAWTSGDWKQTNMLFGQARQELEKWLGANETAEERIARTKASEERVAALETEQDRLRGEINRITTERDQHDQRAKELDKRIADITVERVDAVDDLKATRESLTEEESKRSAAEKVAQERANLVTQLNAEKASLERQNQQLQRKSAELDQVKRELVQAKEQANSLGEQLASAQSEAARWKQFAQTNTIRTRSRQNLKVLAIRKNSLGMEFIRVPAGEYQRGATDGEATASDCEKPRHCVQITNGFYVGKFEVTQAIYEEVMGVNPSHFSAAGGGADTARGVRTSGYPVEGVSWFDAIEFCIKLSALENRRPYYELTNVRRSEETMTSAAVKVLGGDGYRLLTEAEWEYVARSGTTTIFPWGNSLSSAWGNFSNRGPDYEIDSPFLIQTVTVGCYPPNPWGLHDTAGNVWEWVWDWYGEDVYEQFATNAAIDPRGPTSGGERVCRGGAWCFNATQCSSASRLGFVPESGNMLVGFRVAHGLSSE